MNEDEARAFIRPIRREVWQWRLIYTVALVAIWNAAPVALG